MLLGGVLTDLLNWHWIFLVNLPVGIGGLRSLLCAAARETASASGRAARSTPPGAVTVDRRADLAVYAIVNGNDGSRRRR